MNEEPTGIADLRALVRRQEQKAWYWYHQICYPRPR
jgi:hypothetical protein